MTKPENLPPQTSKDHDFLVKHGWRFIGARQAQYGTHYYWDYYIGDPSDDTGCWSKAYIQGDALYRQRRLNKIRVGINPSADVKQQ